jgi:hypothetical protein
MWMYLKYIQQLNNEYKKSLAACISESLDDVDNKAEMVKYNSYMQEAENRCDTNTVSCLTTFMSHGRYTEVHRPTRIQLRSAATENVTTVGTK